MLYDYTPIWALRPGDLVRLTGPGWKLNGKNNPGYGDVVKIYYNHDNDHIFFMWRDPVTGHHVPWTIDDEQWSALLVERRRPKP